MKLKTGMKFALLGVVSPLSLTILYAIATYALAYSDNLVGEHCLPENLKGKTHNDYPPGLRWIKRGWTSACFAEPPVMIAGTQKSVSMAKDGTVGPSSLPERGALQFSVIKMKKTGPLSWWPMGYFAITFKGGLHVRISSARWDENDHYYSLFSVSGKILKAR